MARQQGKTSKSRPITSNPLFPAVVALWCGALLGIGSLVVRVTQLEALVIKSKIDLILPAAAPPLGIKARILIALLLAAVGASLGAIAARRIARPKVEVRERKRSAHSPKSDVPVLRARDAHPDTPARRPISAHEELGETLGQAGGEISRSSAPTPAAPAPGILANRRRGLTVEDQPDHFVPHELAPLPGGQPQILDLAGAELEQAPVATDLNAYTDKEREPDLPSTAVPAAPVALDWNQASPILPQDSPPANEPGERRLFAVAAADRAETHTADAGVAPVVRQVFGQGPVEPQDPATRQIFGVAAVDDHVPVEFVQASGYQTSVFDAARPAPLFAERAAPAPSGHVPAENIAERGEQDSGSTQPSPSASAAPCADAAAPVTVPASLQAPPVELGMTDLAIRLQESMKRRRAARAAAQEAPAQAMPAAPSGPAPSASQPFSVSAPTSPAELPAALRPIALDDLGEDGADDSLDSLLPPRHLVAPAATLPVPTAGDPGVDSQPHEEGAESGGDDEGPAQEDENYASLLRFNPVGGRNPFVRIEEPAVETGTVEPVVIFPGQAPRITPTAFHGSARPTPGEAANLPDTNQESSFRRFDAPSTASAGQTIASNQPAPAVDPEEAERALRSALSNLQRISGAA
ncbi:MAG: hypothetical protein JSR96_14350 [Proteobacteria bacterium]|nr:hypothetical protein [Pseudomonadota bacterium]